MVSDTERTAQLKIIRDEVWNLTDSPLYAYRKEVYITNIVKDRPPDNRDPNPLEIELYVVPLYHPAVALYKASSKEILCKI